MTGRRTISTPTYAPEPDQVFRRFTYVQGSQDFRKCQKKFLALHPSYVSTSPLDDLRKREFKRLRKPGAYLDFTGAGLYPECLVREHARQLCVNVFGNPHSSSPSSSLSSHVASQARTSILEYFDADPSLYTVIFTSNSSSAFHLIGESYPFQKDASRLILPADSHNSVNGLRDFARRAGAETCYVPVGAADAEFLREIMTTRGGRFDSCHDTSLFVLTGQSNLTGFKTNLDLFQAAKSAGFDTLLDAAALAPTTRISLKDLGNSIDAMAVSLYKMVGWPTGLGALVSRKNFLNKLRKPWFAGGTVKFVQVPGDRRILADDYERWEDGTINFLALPVIKPALELLNRHLAHLSIRLPLLMHFTLSSLRSLHHSNGQPLILIHSPSPDYAPSSYGATIALSFLTSSGRRLPCYVVEREASKSGIHIRAGCMCNPGAASALLEMADVIESLTFDEEGVGKDSQAVLDGLLKDGILRISFGLPSTLYDAWCFVRFAEGWAEDECGIPDREKKAARLAECFVWSPSAWALLSRPSYLLREK